MLLKSLKVNGTGTSLSKSSSDCQSVDVEQSSYSYLLTYLLTYLDDLFCGTL